MKLNETSGACDDVHLNTFVIDPATARRFECVKEMVRKQGSIISRSQKLLMLYFLK